MIADGQKILAEDILAIQSKANTSVQNTGNETIAGIKTFSSIPVLPSTNPSSDNQAVRKGFADSTYCRKILSSTTFNIGTGGDYANLNTALDDLMFYHIDYAATVTLKLIAGFTPVSFVQRHPQGGRIVVDFNGNNYQVASSTAFLADYGAVLRLANTGADMTISTASNGTGNGLSASRGGVISLEVSAADDIIVGSNGYGFAYGLTTNLGGTINAPYVRSQYNGFGMLASNRTLIYARYATINNCTAGAQVNQMSVINIANTTLSGNTTNASPAVNTDGNQNSHIYWTAP